MPYDDLERAREHTAHLRRLVLQNRAGCDNPELLHQIGRICRALRTAVSDRQCALVLEELESHARQAYSDNAHREWDSDYMNGADFLRAQLLSQLDWFNNRLFAMEVMRRAAERHGRPHAAAGA